jgi:hypothetical protein
VKAGSGGLKGEGVSLTLPTSLEMSPRRGESRERLTRDDVLDNLTLTWLTNTAISSPRLDRENKLPFFLPMGVAIPVVVSAFPDELYQAPRSWMEQAYPNLIYYNKLDKGGCQELRASFQSLRS